MLSVNAKEFLEDFYVSVPYDRLECEFQENEETCEKSNISLCSR